MAYAGVANTVMGLIDVGLDSLDSPLGIMQMTPLLSFTGHSSEFSHCLKACSHTDSFTCKRRARQQNAIFVQWACLRKVCCAKSSMP